MPTHAQNALLTQATRVLEAQASWTANVLKDIPGLHRTETTAQVRIFSCFSSMGCLIPEGFRKEL